MKTVSKLGLLSAMLVLASCNEKVSPELQEGNSSTPGTTSGSSGGGPTIIPPEYYFKLENTSPIILNHKLHKTGNGNRNAACEVRTNYNLSSDAYRGNPTAHDITCFFEAEELSLFHSGMNWQISASPNTCDFVAYAPYSYYNRIPGDSSATYSKFTCMNDTTGSSHVETAADTLNDYGASGNAGCGQYLIQDNDHIPLANKLPFTVESDEDLCEYNYKDRGMERCDVGTIQVNDLQVTYTPAVPGTPGTPAILKYETKSKTIRCGGSAANCVSGPIKLESELSAMTAGNLISVTTIDEPYTMDYEYPGPIKGQRRGNMSLANFRRDLANRFIDYGNSSKPYAGSYLSSFADPTYSKILDPLLIDYYSRNMFVNGAMMIDDRTDEVGSYWNTISNKNNQRFSRPLAAEPYLGMSMDGFQTTRVNPFYTYYCLDTAKDIKARIRVMVRDWDRVHLGTPDLELLSDIFRGSSARQDIPYVVEVPGDPDNINLFNDYEDWDDILPMERIDSTNLIYRPIPSGQYTQGFFNPNRFLRETLPSSP